VAVTALFFRRLRRFVLAIGVTPPAAVFLFFTTRWLALDYTPCCESEVLDYQRCPSTSASIAGWIAWVVSVVVVAVAAYWVQRVILAAVGLWFDAKPLNISSLPDNSAPGVDGPKVS
jgi:hypothetical protein